MRLLERKSNGKVVLSEFSGENIPAYAILSHTWALDNDEEVRYQEVEAGIGTNKPGYKKIQFCAKQAAADGLRYFWIDTCCIDRRDLTELSTAINSMFRWYQKATRCYVYLQDVPTRDTGKDYQRSEYIREAGLKTSRWFTRGWTVQELIAPASVEFFSSEGELLGNKLSLEATINEITGIPKQVLEGGSVSDFSIDERMSWTEHRNTTLAEDKIYSLLGIFNVSMLPIYGEGKEKASRRLREAIHKSYKGIDFEQFAVVLNRSALPEPVQFVAREKELEEMHKILHGQTTRSIVVLHGLGGIGKTQLATAYALRHREKYTAIFWMNANDEDSLKLSFRNVAQQILKGHASAQVLATVKLENLNDVLNAVKNWLGLRGNLAWLMIYDNYDNPRLPGTLDSSTLDLRRFLPEPDQGSIIITTRSSRVSLGRQIKVQKLQAVQEGVEILSNTSGRNGVEADAAALELVDELDGLPLALSTAGLYLEQVTTSFSEYLQLYKTSWIKLQMTSPSLSSYNRSLYTTWQLSLDQIIRENVLSAKLLKLWAYFDRQDVWFELLQQGKDPWIRELTQDRLNFDEAIRLLCNYALVEPDLSLREQPHSKGYSMHSCVHSWTVSVLNKEWDDSLARLALQCLGSIKIRKKDSWLLQWRLLPHALRHQHSVTDGMSYIEGMEWALHKVGQIYSGSGKLNEAEKMFARALQGLEERRGLKHIKTLQTLNSLGHLYQDQSKLDEAEKMHTRALQGYEEVFGPKHFKTLNTFHWLGFVYHGQGKLDEAEKMYTRVLQGFEEVFGPNHIFTLLTVISLGSLYQAQGKLDEAEKMYIRVLREGEGTLELNDTTMLDTICNLGRLCKKQGKLDEAEKLYTRALYGFEEVYGPNHYYALQKVYYLGRLYEDQGKLDKAEKMYIRALQGYEETLGNHAFTFDSALDVMADLGILLLKTERKDSAKEYLVKALSGYAIIGGSSRCRYLEDRIQALNTTRGKEAPRHFTSRRDLAKRLVKKVFRNVSSTQRSNTSIEYCVS